MANKDHHRGSNRWYDEPVIEGRKRHTLTHFLQALFTVFMLVVALTIYRFLEPYIYPAITDFVVDKVEYRGPGIYISGTMDKKRFCIFRAASALGTSRTEAPTLFEYSFIGKDGSTPLNNQPNASLGKQKWGPVFILLPEENWKGRIHLSAIHSCWGLWLTETDLTEFTVNKDLQ